MSKKTYTVTAFGDEYTCTQFFDTDKGTGIDISDYWGDHVGEIIGETIPDSDSDTDEIHRFKLMVEAWLTDNEK